MGFLPELDREKVRKAEKILRQVRDACLYAEDDGTTGVTSEPTIDAYLFDEICTWLNTHGINNEDLDACECSRCKSSKAWEEYWTRRYEIVRGALRNPDKFPEPAVLSVLNDFATWSEDWEKGKQLQRIMGLEAIPPNSECETGAGFWYRMTHSGTVKLVEAVRAEERARQKELLHLERKAADHFEHSCDEWRGRTKLAEQQIEELKERDRQLTAKLARLEQPDDALVEAVKGAIYEYNEADHDDTPEGCVAHIIQSLYQALTEQPIVYKVDVTAGVPEEYQYTERKHWANQLWKYYNNRDVYEWGIIAAVATYLEQVEDGSDTIVYKTRR